MALSPLDKIKWLKSLSISFCFVLFTAEYTGFLATHIGQDINHETFPMPRAHNKRTEFIYFLFEIDELKPYCWWIVFNRTNELVLDSLKLSAWNLTNEDFQIVANKLREYIIHLLNPFEISACKREQTFHCGQIQFNSISFHSIQSKQKLK